MSEDTKPDELTDDQLDSLISGLTGTTDPSPIKDLREFNFGKAIKDTIVESAAEDISVLSEHEAEQLLQKFDQDSSPASEKSTNPTAGLFSWKLAAAVTGIVLAGGVIFQLIISPAPDPFSEEMIAIMATPVGDIVGRSGDLFSTLGNGADLIELSSDDGSLVVLTRIVKNSQTAYALRRDSEDIYSLSMTFPTLTDWKELHERTLSNPIPETAEDWPTVTDWLSQTNKVVLQHFRTSELPYTAIVHIRLSEMK